MTHTKNDTYTKSIRRGGNPEQYKKEYKLQGIIFFTIKVLRENNGNYRLHNDNHILSLPYMLHNPNDSGVYICSYGEQRK